MSKGEFPEGWYPYPQPGSQRLRWWTGTEWTELEAPKRRFGKVPPAPELSSGVRLASGDTGSAAPKMSGKTRNMIIAAALAVVGLIVLVALLTRNYSFLLISIGLVIGLTGLYSFITKRPSWAQLSTRKSSGIAQAAGLVLLVAGAAIVPAPAPIEQGAAFVDANTPEQLEAPTEDPITPDAVDDPELPLDPKVPLKAGFTPEVAITEPITIETATELLGELEVKGRASKTGYDREAKFGAPWVDLDSNLCDTRNDILQRDLADTKLSGSCRVLTGVLTDPYTGDTVHFERGSDTSQLVQIDHVVSLSDAWQKGAQKLSQHQRITLANDPINLYAVGGAVNNAKGNGDAATWLPPAKAFRCEYVARQISVKATYKLWVTQAEKEAMQRVLSGCGDQPVVHSVYEPAPEPAELALEAQEVPVAPPPAEPVPVAPVAPPAPPPAAPVDVYYENCTAVRAAGASPLYQGQPGYTTKLDRDKDGVACE